MCTCTHMHTHAYTKTNVRLSLDTSRGSTRQVLKYLYGNNQEGSKLQKHVEAYSGSSAHSTAVTQLEVRAASFSEEAEPQICLGWQQVFQSIVSWLSLPKRWKIKSHGAREMARKLRACTTLPDNLSSIPSTYISQVAYSPLLVQLQGIPLLCGTCTRVHLPTHIHII